jgi:CO/xanthine dehydrogenase Mo-binding subunit
MTMTSIEHITDGLLTEKAFSRRSLLKAGGALVLVASVPVALRPGVAKADLEPTAIQSWLAVQADNTVLAFSGRTEVGVGTRTGFSQIVAEELDVPLESVKLVMGDTDKTTEGGYSAGGVIITGGSNMRKASAYARAALLDLASKQLSVPVDSLTVKNGVVSGGGKSATYADLVKGQVLNVSMPVTGTYDGFGMVVGGNPKLKDPSTYSIVGKPVPRLDIPGKITGNWTYVQDVTVPGMLHARIVRPKTLGSTLVKVDGFGSRKVPNVQVVTKGNLVAVVAPTEWEAITAARLLKVTWTDWAGLPGNGNTASAMRKATNVRATVAKKTGDLAAAQAAAAKKVSASYETPFEYHAPIGPFTAIADVAADGTTKIWSAGSGPQLVRGRIAQQLSVPVSKVTVYHHEGASWFGRTSINADDAATEAALISQAVGKPVRVQWTRQEDHMWSYKSPPHLHDMEAALDANGNITGWHHVNWTMTTDTRNVGAILAGLPGNAVPPASGGFGATWIYDKIPNVLLEGRGLQYFGADAPSGVGLRTGILRSPGDAQSNFGVENFMNEVAAAAGADPIEFRIRHTSDKRAIGVLRAVQQAARWQTRPSPAAGAKATGAKTVKGRGVAATLRALDDTWIAAVAEIEVTPSTGHVQVTHVTVAHDSGFVVNPTIVKQNIQSGVLQTMSRIRKEEVTFDKSNVTSKDWQTYKIGTMADAPKLTIVLINDKDFNTYPPGGVGEPIANLIMPAIAGAFHDATGKIVRKTPLTAGNVKAQLKA